MRRPLILIGLLITLIGICWPWISRLPIGRLPGDILIDKPGFKLFIPLTTMLLVSLIISALLWLFRR
jgi:hypothetical protein